MISEVDLPIIYTKKDEVRIFEKTSKLFGAKIGPLNEYQNCLSGLFVLITD
jgi:hypothetical protein